MNEFLLTCLIVCPLVFLATFVDAVAGGGGLISIPAYMLAGVPTHMALGTNKVVNGIGTGCAAWEYFRGGRMKLLIAVPAALGALVGAGYSEIMARGTKVPVPVYMVPCVIPLVPGGGLYGTRFNFVTGNYPAAAEAGLRTLQTALGIAGGVVIASVLGILFRPRLLTKKKR